MGLAALPSPSEGMLCVFLDKTAVSFAIVKFLVRVLLVFLRFSLSSPTEPDDSDPTHVSSYPDESRVQARAVRFDSICKYRISPKGETEPGCSVCLTGFEPESVINHLYCGHVFHKKCLGRWLDYSNITCPLCRASIAVPEDDA